MALSCLQCILMGQIVCHEKCTVRSFPSPFTPSHQYAYSPYYALDILTWRICFKIKVELLKLVIVSFVLMTLISDPAVMLLGEIRCESLLGV